jgi:hypothetical protein
MTTPTTKWRWLRIHDRETTLDALIRILNERLKKLEAFLENSGGGSGGGSTVTVGATLNPPENLPLHASALNTSITAVPAGYSEPWSMERTAALIRGHKAVRIVVDVLTALGTGRALVRYGLADEAFSAMSDLGTAEVRVDLDTTGTRRGPWIPLAPAAIGADATLAWGVWGPDGAAPVKLGSVKVEFDDGPNAGSTATFALTSIAHPNTTWAASGIYYLKLGLPPSGGDVSVYSTEIHTCAGPGFPIICSATLAYTTVRTWRSKPLAAGYVNGAFTVEALMICFDPFLTWGIRRGFYFVSLHASDGTVKFSGGPYLYDGVGSILTNRPAVGWFPLTTLAANDYFEVQAGGLQVGYAGRPDDTNRIQIHHGGDSFNNAGDDTAGMLQVLGSVAEL